MIAGVSLTIGGYLHFFVQAPGAFYIADALYGFIIMVSSGVVLLFIASLSGRGPAAFGLVGLIITWASLLGTYVFMIDDNEFAVVFIIFFIFGSVPLGVVILAITSIVSILISYRRQYGICGVCGYDLRSLTEPRCPECGMPFDPKLNEEQSEDSASVTDAEQTRP